MKRIDIAGVKGIKVIAETKEDEKRIENYVVKDGKKWVIDFFSTTYRKANKNEALKKFAVEVRVSKFIDGRQRYKRRVYRYDGEATLRKAVESLLEEQERLLEELIEEYRDAKTAEEAKSAREEKARAKFTVEKVWEEYFEKKTTPASELRNWKPTTARSYRSFFSKWIAG